MSSPSSSPQNAAVQESKNSYAALASVIRPYSQTPWPIWSVAGIFLGSAFLPSNPRRPPLMYRGCSKWQRNIHSLVIDVSISQSAKFLETACALLLRALVWSYYRFFCAIRLGILPAARRMRHLVCIIPK
ncbi:hypothetical protein ABKN59_001575 [Abortiporus biennis]